MPKDSTYLYHSPNGLNIFKLIGEYGRYSGVAAHCWYLHNDLSPVRTLDMPVGVDSFPANRKKPLRRIPKNLAVGPSTTYDCQLKGQTRKSLSSKEKISSLSKVINKEFKLKSILKKTADKLAVYPHALKLPNIDEEQTDVEDTNTSNSEKNEVVGVSKMISNPLKEVLNKPFQKFGSQAFPTHLINMPNGVIKHTETSHQLRHYKPVSIPADRWDFI